MMHWLPPLLCATALGAASTDDQCAIEPLQRGDAAILSVRKGLFADRAEALVGPWVVAAYKRRRPPVGRGGELLCRAFYDLEIKVCGGATAAIKAAAPDCACPREPGRGRRHGANGPEDPRVVARPRGGFVVLYTDWRPANGSYERSTFMVTGAVAHSGELTLGAPEGLDGADGAPFYFGDELYTQHLDDGGDALVMKIGGNATRCPNAGTALRQALGGDKGPLYDHVTILPGSNAVLVGNEYVAVGRTLRTLGHEKRLEALFAYTFDAAPPFCLRRTTPEFHAPVPHAASSEAFGELLDRRRDPGRHREGVQAPTSLVATDEGLRLAVSRKAHVSYTMLLNASTLLRDARSLNYGDGATVERYLRAVYPAMAPVDDTQLRALYASLDYFYRGPALPYVPAGVYYSAADATTDDPGTRDAVARARRGGERGALDGSYGRWTALLRRVPSERKELASSFGARLGPAPSWTHAAAAVKYVLYPLGLHPDALREDVLRRPQNPLDGLWDVPERPKKFASLRTGDYLEVEQYGGPDWVASEFPIVTRGIAGLFCNVWRGTGVGLRVVAPFVARSKGAAVAELLREVGRRQDLTQGEDYVSALAALSGVGGPDAGAVLSSQPRKSGLSHEARAVRLAVGLLALPVPCATSWDAIDARWRRWRDTAVDTREAAAFAPPSGAWRAKRPIEDLFAELALRKEAPANASLAALHWIYGLCSKSPYYSGPANKQCAAERRRGTLDAGACKRRWLAWDNLLMVLSCAIGAKTLVLDASPNDNGLFHEELIDYDVPGAWPTLEDGTSLNPLAECLAPFDDGRAAPARADVLEHWRATRKFGRVDPVAGTAAPCDLVGSDGTELGDHNGGGYLACKNSLSESHALCVRDRERTKRPAGARRPPGCGR